MYWRPICCPTVFSPAIICPNKMRVNHTCVNNIVPHVHPSHTTTVNHINYQHQHHFPHTKSVVNEVQRRILDPYQDLRHHQPAEWDLAART